MSDYLIDEASFTLPSGWFDRSLNVLGPEPNEDELKVLISRAEQNGRVLDDFVDGQVKDLSQRLPWFELRGRGERTVAGTRALEVRSSFRDGKASLVQYQVTLAIRDKFVTITAVGLERAERTCAQMLEGMIASARLRIP